MILWYLYLVKLPSDTSSEVFLNNRLSSIPYEIHGGIYIPDYHKQYCDRLGPSQCFEDTLRRIIDPLNLKGI